MSGFVEVVTEVVTNEYGEVESFRKKEVTKKRIKAPVIPFTMMLSDDLDQVMKLPGGELKLFLKLGHLADFSGHVDMSQYMTQKICKECKISRKTLSNQICSLKKKCLISVHEFSKLEISPLFFFKGKFSQLGQRQTDFREKRLKAGS